MQSPEMILNVLNQLLDRFVIIFYLNVELKKNYLYIMLRLKNEIKIKFESLMENTFSKWKLNPFMLNFNFRKLSLLRSCFNNYYLVNKK